MRENAFVEAQAAIAAAAPKNDPEGIRGSGGKTTAHRSGGRPAGGNGPSARLFHTGQPAIEPSLGITPSGEIFVNTLSPFVVVETPVRRITPQSGAVSRSVDGGRSWQEVSPRVADRKTHTFPTQDPYLYVDPATGRIFQSDLRPPANCSDLSFSDDLGETWTNTVVGCDQTDHQNIFAGPPPPNGPQPSGYPNIVYYCAVNGGIQADFSTATTCSRSTDGGRTFVLTGEPAYVDKTGQAGGEKPEYLGIPGHCSGATGHGFAAPDGTVYLPRGHCGQPFLAISRDAGATWERVQVADNGMNTARNGASDHEAGVVADEFGNVYYTWVGRDRHPYLAVSRDRGATWSAPMDVGAPGLRQALNPGIALGAPGKVAIAYMGSTNASGPPFADDINCSEHPDCAKAPTNFDGVTYDGWVTQTANALEADPLFYSGTVNDPREPLVRGRCGPIVRCQQQFDFSDVQISPADGSAYAAFVGPCEASGCLGEGIVGRFVGGPSLTSRSPRRDTAGAAVAPQTGPPSSSGVAPATRALPVTGGSSAAGLALLPLVAGLAGGALLRHSTRHASPGAPTAMP
jgi:hypothetical protein